MQDFVVRLREEVKQHQLWQPDSKLLLAVSGGADSMALLAAIACLPEQERPAFAVVHVHHHLREESDEELEMVQGYCAERSIPFYAKHWLAERHPVRNVEQAAREFRYSFFAEMLQRLQATHVLTAHHADDQLETILMRLVRGSTLQGMTGIARSRPFKGGKLVRPLLAFQKQELYAFCAEENIPYREDATNQETSFTRNRYRQLVVPLLKEENEQVTRHFSEFSDDLQDLLQVAQPMIARNFAQAFTKKEAGWHLDLPAWREMAPALQRSVLSHFISVYWIAAGGTFQRNQMEAIMALIENPSPQKQISLSGGWQVRKRYDTLIFLSALPTESTEMEIHEKLELNRWVELPFHGKIGLFPKGNALPKDVAAGAEIFYVAADCKALPFLIRSRRPGDKIVLNKNRPFTKKVSRLFVDAKVPREARQQAIVVTDSEDRLLWVPGYAESVWLSETESMQDRYVLVYIK